MAKYTARFALGLSNSVPGLKLEPAQILSVDDNSMSLFVCSLYEILANVPRSLVGGF
jgi:hypothetical protein